MVLAGMMVAVLACPLVLPASVPESVPDSAAQESSARQQQIAQALPEEGLVGAVWSTIDQDGAVDVAAAGVADGKTGRAMTGDSRVHVGSVAKVVLGAGVLRLISEGRLSLDAPVASLLPSLAFDNPWEASDPIRVRHLLAHTAGLENLRMWQFFSLQADADAPLSRMFMRDPSVLRVQARPGARFRYSNLGYTLLGMVIESVTGQRYEHYLDAPLAMTDSTFAYTAQTGPDADDRLAMGHFEDGRPQAAIALHLRPAAQFTTTARDMATFSRFLMGDGRVDGRSFIDPRLLQAMTSPDMTSSATTSPGRTEAAEAGLRIGHGLLLAGRDRHGVSAECHPGNTIGFMAMLCLFPREDKAFFIAFNADSETADYERFHALLIRSLGIAGTRPAEDGEASGDIADWQGFYVPQPLSMRPFAWIDTVLGVSRIQWDGTRLHIASLQSKHVQLQPLGGHLFRAGHHRQASHVLLTSTTGERVVSNGLQTLVRIETNRIVLLWSSLLAGVLGLGYVLAVGTARRLRGRLGTADALFAPWLATLALLLPLPFFLAQPVLALGDRTVASVLLAAVTGLLPLALLFGMGMCAHASRRPGVYRDALALLAALQCLLVLVAWGMLPFRLWH